MLAVLIFLGVVLGAHSGTLCPPKEDIYPCTCFNAKGKSWMTTTVYCSKVPNSDSLGVIFSSFKKMHIDAFHLHDSFWDAHGQGNIDEHKRVLPEEWLINLKSKEIEIKNTPLDKDFACKLNFPCSKNTITTRFTAINSTTSKNLITLCQTGRGNVYPWMSCMTKLKELQFSDGELSIVDKNFFPIRMNSLQILILSKNKIKTIEDGAFKNVLSLRKLDLSDNRIVSLKGVFRAPMSLQILDVSGNYIQTLGEIFFTNLAELKTFNLSSNSIMYLPEEDWTPQPETIRKIDLRMNHVHCNCSIKWINRTFKNNVLQGRCESPENYAGHSIKAKATHLSKTCDEDGNIGKLKKDSPTDIIPTMHQKYDNPEEKQQCTEENS